MSELYYLDNIKHIDILKWFLKTGDIDDVCEVAEFIGCDVKCLLTDIKKKSVLIDVMNKVKAGLKSIHYTITEESSDSADIDKYRGMRSRLRKDYCEKGYIDEPYQPTQQVEFIYNQEATYKQIKKFIKGSPFHTNMIYQTLTKYDFEIKDFLESDKRFIERAFRHLKEHSLSLFISIDRMALCC